MATATSVVICFTNVVTVVPGAGTGNGTDVFVPAVTWCGQHTGPAATNFQTIKKNIRRLKDLERGVEEGAFEFYTKKERLLLEREREKLERGLDALERELRLKRR